VRKSSGYKKRRLDVVSIKWNEESLKALLNERVKDASNVRAPLTIARLCTDQLSEEVDVEAQLIQIALHHPELGPPRALLELAGLLFESREYETGQDPRLSLTDWEKFIQSRDAMLDPPEKPSDSTATNLAAIPEVRPDLLDDPITIAASWERDPGGLRQRMKPSFSMDELNILINDLDIDPDDIKGETKSNKIRELIDYLIRRGKLPELIKLLLRERPNRDWKPPSQAT
jgi:hypothetical protein